MLADDERKRTSTQVQNLGFQIPNGKYLSVGESACQEELSDLIAEDNVWHCLYA